MSFSTAPPGAGRQRRDPPPQRELTAANLAQQRSQPFEARMPAVKPKDGERHALPLGRDGAVCALCGNPGHDAEVCADRPAPRIRMSLDLDEDGDPIGVPSQLQEEPSMSSIPDSPSHLFPKPTAAEALAMRKKIEQLETKRQEKEAASMEKKLRALDELHRDATDGAGNDRPDHVHSRFDPYPLSPKRTFKPPPTREEILAKQAAELEAEREAKLIAEEAAGALNRRPPLPRPDQSFEGSDLIDGIAAWQEAHRQVAVEDTEEAARQKRKAERERIDQARARQAAAAAAKQAAENGENVPTTSANDKNAASASSEALPEIREETFDPYQETGGVEDSSEMDPKQRARILLEAKAASNPMPGGQASGLASDLRQVKVTSQAPVLDDDVVVATTVERAVANVVQTGIQPDYRLYEPEGGFQGMLDARKAAEKDAADAREELKLLRIEAASKSMALFEEREQHAIELEQSNQVARDAMEKENRADLQLEETIATMNALRVRCDATIADVKQDAEANVEAARMASQSVAEESRKVRALLEEVRTTSAKEQSKTNEIIVSLRRQLERAESSARNDKDEMQMKLESVEADLTAACNEISRAEEQSRREKMRAEDAEVRAEVAERRAISAEASERKLVSVRRKTAEAVAVRQGLERDVSNAEQAAASAGVQITNAPRVKREPVKKPNSKPTSVATEITAARAMALKEAAEQLAMETRAGATAKSIAKRVRRKAVEAELDSAKSELSLAPGYLKQFRVAARVFVCAGSDHFATTEMVINLEQAGYSSSSRPQGAECAPGRARSAEAFLLLDSGETRNDHGVEIEVSAAVESGRRVFVLCDVNDEQSARDKWRAFEIESGMTFITHGDASAQQAVTDTLATVTNLGVPDTFLKALSPTTLTQMSTDPRAPDFVNLAGATLLTFNAKKSKDTLENQSAVYETLADVLLLNAPEDIRTIKIGQTIANDVAQRIGKACSDSESNVQSVCFGGALLPVGAIRDAGKTATSTFHLDMTVFHPAAVEAVDFGIGTCELYVLHTALETSGATVTSVALPPWLPASVTRTTLRAIMGQLDDDSDESNMKPYPTVNGVPSQFETDCESIDLQNENGKPFGVPGAVALERALDWQSGLKIKQITVNGANLGAEGGSVFAKMLSVGTFAELEALVVTNSELGGIGVESLCASLPKSLNTLDLGGNAAGDRCGSSACVALKRCPSLRRIGLSRNDIGVEGALKLSPSVRDHASLTEIHLDGNRVGDRGLGAIAAAVRATKAPVEKLWVANNSNLTAACCKPLSVLLCGSETLRELDLSKAMIGAEGVKALFSGVMTGGSTSLETLELSGCRLRAEGAKFLGDALGKLTCLKYLGVGKNSLGDKGVFELALRGLSTVNLSLNTIDLRHNAIGPEGLKKLKLALERKCVSVRVVRLDGNKLDEKKVLDVEEMVRRERVRVVVKRVPMANVSLSSADIKKKNVSTSQTRPALRAKAVLEGKNLTSNVAKKPTKKSETINTIVEKENEVVSDTTRDTLEGTTPVVEDSDLDDGNAADFESGNEDDFGRDTSLEESPNGSSVFVPSARTVSEPVEAMKTELDPIELEQEHIVDPGKSLVATAIEHIEHEDDAVHSLVDAAIEHIEHEDDAVHSLVAAAIEHIEQWDDDVGHEDDTSPQRASIVKSLVATAIERVSAGEDTQKVFKKKKSVAWKPDVE